MLRGMVGPPAAPRVGEQEPVQPMGQQAGLWGRPVCRAPRQLRATPLTGETLRGERGLGSCAATRSSGRFVTRLACRSPCMVMSVSWGGGRLEDGGRMTVCMSAQAESAVLSVSACMWGVLAQWLMYRNWVHVRQAVSVPPSSSSGLCCDAVLTVLCVLLLLAAGTAAMTCSTPRLCPQWVQHPLLPA